MPTKSNQRSNRQRKRQSDPGIYQIRCRANGMRYVGQAKDIQKRWKQHKSQLNQGNHANKRLQADWKSYGEDAFELKVLERCPKLLLDFKEAYWIARNGDYNRQRPTAFLYGWWWAIDLSLALLMVGGIVWLFFR
jgi:hypothetical protein